MKTTALLIATLTLALWTAPSTAADVKANWEKHCQKCHGADGKGDTKMGKKLGVKDYTDAKVQAEMTDEQIIKLTKEGKKEGDQTKMKPYADVLSEEEIKAFVAFIRAMKK
ncbi:MAG: cytochrome c [Verrucomicrobiota bacterium]